MSAVAKLPATPSIERKSLDSKGLQRLVIGIGSESYCPVAFNSFTVGAISCEFDVAEGETVMDVYNRASLLLREMNQLEFEQGLDRYMARLKSANAAVLARAESNRKDR